jgi:hypothetical protein
VLDVAAGLDAAGTAALLLEPFRLETLAPAVWAGVDTRRRRRVVLECLMPALWSVDAARPTGLVAVARDCAQRLEAILARPARLGRAAGVAPDPSPGTAVHTRAEENRRTVQSCRERAAPAEIDLAWPASVWNGAS